MYPLAYDGNVAAFNMGHGQGGNGFLEEICTSLPQGTD